MTSFQFSLVEAEAEEVEDADDFITAAMFPFLVRFQSVPAIDVSLPFSVRFVVVERAVRAGGSMDFSRLGELSDFSKVDLSKVDDAFSRQVTITLPVGVVAVKCDLYVIEVL